MTLEQYFQNLSNSHHVLADRLNEPTPVIVADFQSVLEGTFAEVSNAAFVVVLVQPVSRIIGDDTGNVEEVETGFMIYKACTIDKDSIVFAQKQIRKIIKQFIARMIYDSRREVGPFANSLNHLGDGDFLIDDKQFAGNGIFAGSLCTFKYNVPYIGCIDAEVRATMWSDLPSDI